MQYSINILFVGRLDTQKNPLGLLEVARKVVEKKSNVKFSLVGDGEFYDLCKNYIKENNLEKNIYLAGWQTNPGEFYAKADIFVCFSIYEAFGLMFLEAGCFHLPICATNVEGIPEVVIDGETGLLCNPNDENAMANNILKLCDEKQLRHKMGEASYKRATEVFSVENMVKKYNSIYNAN
ncbi:glycosyltransferase [uncultured Treponema sp.]|uniref:glycosyltransferase n=1 Tax=uncultured Treponema sp. TaxID=162155 RepID=UPI002589C130|nr:glycosyltransferase [uncultured Treponema sp.]